MEDGPGWEWAEFVLERRWYDEKEIGMAFAMRVPKAGGGEFANPTPGTVSAVCTRLIDLGTQETPWGQKRLVLVSFEIDEQMNDGRPFLVSKRYTSSLHEKARLRQDIEGWRGRPLSEGGFDLKGIVGKPAMLNLVENEKGYINISSINPLPRSMSPLKPSGELLVFDLDDPNWDAYSSLSERMQQTISASPEYQEAMNPKTPEVDEAVEDEFADEIPF